MATRAQIERLALRIEAPERAGASADRRGGPVGIAPVLKSKDGVYYVRKKVPAKLEEAVSRVLGAPRQHIMAQAIIAYERPARGQHTSQAGADRVRPDPGKGGRTSRRSP
jgi:hypothetical protein